MSAIPTTPPVDPVEAGSDPRRGATVDPSANQRARHRRVLGVAGRYVLLILVLFISVGPFLWQISTSLKGPEENIFAFPPTLIPESPTLNNYLAVMDSLPLGTYLLNSAYVSIGAVIGNCLFGAMAGYALARMRFRGREGLFAMMIATLVIPFEVIMISVFLVTRDLGLINTLTGALLPVALTVLSIFIMRQAFVSLHPEIEEAARVDGAGEWQLFWKVAMPSARGSLAVVAIFSFMAAWDDFLWPLIVLRDASKFTLTVGLVFLDGQFSADQRLIAAGTIIAIIPVLALFIALQKQFFRGVGQAAVKG
ncbi:MAG: carbohydrate ABC transporter permease [Nitriliruptoraceae bacterium]|nr:carbohydrate ABC transporter permease [Nitriliruptoraceae bacterium]